MKFFSGFSLKNETYFFSDYLSDSDYNIAGFSYGAIKAAEFAAASKERIDVLQLFSPAFFQSTHEKFRRLQMMAYKKDRSAYLQQFIERCFEPFLPPEGLERVETTAEELHALLYYEWSPGLLQRIAEKGTRIEVYLGEYDKIIDPQRAREFFRPLATVFFIKRANHFLNTS